MAARSKAWFDVRSVAEIVGSFPAEGVDGCLMSVVRCRYLRGAHQSYREGVPSVVCLSVTTKLQH